MLDESYSTTGLWSAMLVFFVLSVDFG
jgi:hypothetical protein